MKALNNKLILTIGAVLTLFTVSASAVPIVYNDDLSDGVEEFGATVNDGLVAFDSTDYPLGDYWTFSVLAGDMVTVTARRTEGEMDPVMAMWLGAFGDTDDLPGLFDEFFADDELGPAVAGAFGDPEIMFTAAADATYTISVWDHPFSGVACTGGSSTFLCEYRIVVSGSTAVPEPGSLALFGLAMIGAAGARRKRR